MTAQRLLLDTGTNMFHQSIGSLTLLMTTEDGEIGMRWTIQI